LTSATTDDSGRNWDETIRERSDALRELRSRPGRTRRLCRMGAATQAAALEPSRIKTRRPDRLIAGPDVNSGTDLVPYLRYATTQHVARALADFSAPCRGNWAREKSAAAPFPWSESRRARRSCVPAAYSTGSPARS